MLQDAVVAIVPSHRLGNLLPAIHRAGLGYLARVASPAKNRPLLEQLQRAGIPASQAPEVVSASEQIIFLQAGGRSMMTARLLLEEGLSQVWIVNTFGAWVPVDDAVVAATSTPAVQPSPRQEVPGRRVDVPVLGEADAGSDAETGPLY